MPLPSRPFWRTLRFRLTMWNVVLVLVTSLATVFGLRWGVRYALLRELDEVLQADLHEIALVFESASMANMPQVKQNLERKAEFHQHQGWYVELLDDHDRVLWESGKREIGGPADTLRRDDPNSVHSYQQSVPAVDRIQAIRVGSSLQFIHDDMQRIDRLVVFVAVVALCVAPLGGYLLAVRAIKPLTDMTAIASRLAPHQLDQRLPMRSTGDELDVLSQTINGLLDRIAAHLQGRRDLLANSAHELRSPLAAIRSCVEVASNERRSPEEYEELLIDIISQCEGLETLVNQLLLLAETEEVELPQRREQISWSEVVETTMDMFSAAAEVADVQLTAQLQPGVIVHGNREHLRQVVNNLLDNAIKYTPGGGKVRVELTLNGKRECILKVADTGVGIAAGDLPRVFERFFRGDKARRREHGARGTGLGLSICQSVVEAHGGKISIQSEPNSGTVVTVVLPTKQ